MNIEQKDAVMMLVVLKNVVSNGKYLEDVFQVKPKEYNCLFADEYGELQWEERPNSIILGGYEENYKFKNAMEEIHNILSFYTLKSRY